MPKWLFWLALFFVLFLIYTQPADAGNIAGGFAEFAVDLLDALAQFVNGLFDGASSNTDSGGLDSSRLDSGTLSSDTGATTDPTFTHTHDGTQHTHSG